MRHLKTFNKFKINEAYRELDRSDYRNDYDYAFANYALNEKPFGFNEEQRKKAQSLYGNREVGVIYHGGKLNNKEHSEIIKSLKPGDTIKANMMSATPEYSTAESFALYVKSYDEMTMMYALKDAIENGSAGTYGTFVVTLKPKPEQVIFSTYGEGETPTRSAETEVVLYGDIEVVDIKIFEPLSKETYLEDFMEMSPLSLSNDFMKRWFSSNKLPRPNSDYIKKVLNKITSDEEAIEFITNQSEKRWVFGELTMDEAGSNKYIKKQFTNVVFENGNFYFDFPGKVHIGVIDGLKEWTWNNNRTVLLDYYNEISKNSDVKIEFKENRSWAKDEYDINISDSARRLLNVYSKLKELGESVKLHPQIKSFENDIVGYFEDVIIGKHIKDFSSKELEAMRNTLRNLENYGDVILKVIGVDAIKPGLLYLYQSFAHRHQANTKEDKYKIRDYAEIVPYALKLLTIK